MDQTIRMNLEKEHTPFRGNPALDSRDVIHLAELSYGKLELRLEHLGISIDSKMDEFAEAAYRVMTETLWLERPARQELILHARTLFSALYGVDPEVVELDLELVDPEQVEFDPQNMTPPLTLTENDPELALEIHKRHLINLFIQGAASRSQDLIFMMKDEIELISPRLFELYQEVMARGDHAYWHMKEDVREQAQGSSANATKRNQSDLPEKNGTQTGSRSLIFGLVRLWNQITTGVTQAIRSLTNKNSNLGQEILQPPTGTSQVDPRTEPAQIRARAICLPILLHEMGKGWAELLALHGLPKDPIVRAEVLRQADAVSNEAWGLRLGPEAWDRLLAHLGKSDPRERNRRIKKLFSLPADEFHREVRTFLST